MEIRVEKSRFQVDFPRLLIHIIGELTAKPSSKINIQPNHDQIRQKLFNAFENDPYITDWLKKYENSASRESGGYKIYTTQILIEGEIILVELFKHQNTAFHLDLKLNRAVIRSCYHKDINSLLLSVKDINNWTFPL